MRNETAIGAAMAAAGIDGSEARLYAAAVDAIRESKKLGTPRRAAEMLGSYLKNDREAVLALFRRYLSEVEADMNFSSSRAQRGSGHVPFGAQEGVAAAKNEDGSGHDIVGDRNDNVRPSSANRGGVSQKLRDTRSNAALSVREPSKLQIAASAMVSNMAARTVFDSFMVNGRPIGDIQYGELEHLERHSVCAASVLRQIRKHVANAAPEMVVRLLVNKETLERMIQKAAEMSDAA